MWPLIAIIIVIFIAAVIVAALFRAILFVYDFLLTVWPLTLGIVVVIIAWYSRRYYKKNATYGHLNQRIELIQQEYSKIFSSMNDLVMVSETDIPSTHRLKYLTASSDPVEKRLSYLFKSAGVYNKYIELNKNISTNLSQDSLNSLVADFDPLSYSSEESLEKDVERLSNAFDCYQQYSKIADGDKLESHLKERQLVPPTPSTIDELSDKISRIETLVNLVEAYFGAMNAYHTLRGDQDIEAYGELQGTVDNELSSINNSQDMNTTLNKFTQIKRLFDIHVSNPEETYKTQDIIELSDHILSGNYTQYTKAPVDAYAKFVNVLDSIEQEDTLMVSTKEELRDILRLNKPMESPQETISHTNLINDVIPLLSQLETVDQDLLLPTSREIHNEILSDLKSQALTEKIVSENLELITTAKTLADFIEKNKKHPTVDVDQWESEITQALEERYPQRLKPLDKHRERMLDNYWEKDDLYKFDWKEFEELIGALFAAEGYDVEVTEGTHDFGVDVYAENDNGKLAIQVKQFAEGNRVGREPLQIYPNEV
ncbi:restriction endonuclease [Halalkalirubrum salinum]|uniref:restriction endonuclease n=1 Tax=Halalkalirubrum salinum TaxID=2563889 RepID=UPI0010FAD60A|nr:restriction endonuclease [Halalkalirubrum salinum]